MRFTSKMVLADIVTLLVKKALVDFIVTHEVVIIIFVGQFNPLIAVNAAFLVI